MNKTHFILLRSASPLWTAGAGASLFFGWPLALIIIGAIFVVCALAGIIVAMVRRNGSENTPSDAFIPPPSKTNPPLDSKAEYPAEPEPEPEAETAFSALSSADFPDIHESSVPPAAEDPADPPEMVPIGGPDPEPTPCAESNVAAPDDATAVQPAAASAAEAPPAPQAEPAGEASPVSAVTPIPEVEPVSPVPEVEPVAPVEPAVEINLDDILPPSENE